MGPKEIFQKILSTMDVHLFSVSGTAVTLATLAFFLVILFLSFHFSRAVERLILKAFKKHDAEAPGNLAVAARLIYYALLMLGLGIALHTIGINMTGLFAAGAVFAVGVGFAMQNIASNFVSGVILLLEGAIKPGDVLEVEDRVVRVREMGMRAAVARTLDDEDLIVPNSALVQSTVKNFTLRDHLYRLKSTVGVVYSSDMAKVEETLVSLAEKLPWRSDKRKPQVLLTEFGDSSVNFEVSVWTEDPWRQRLNRSQLNQAVWWALKDVGVTIAFPQLDLHLDSVVVESLKHRLPS